MLLCIIGLAIHNPQPQSGVDSAKSLKAFILTIPGDILDVSFLVNKKKKFRNRGGRDAAIESMKELECEGMGKLVLKDSKGPVKVLTPLMRQVSKHCFELWYIADLQLPQEEGA